MTDLARLLSRRIALNGPITLADYMTDCLLHPGHGYYATRDPFGAAGDFTTAPEISQMFGELLGLSLAQCWLDQGAPAPFTLAELGPGRGTLMADLLRATRSVPGFHAAARLHLVEVSPVLRACQRTSLGTHPALWLDRTEDLPDAPLFLMANEFFDALPIRQFQRDTDGWREKMVGLAGDTLAFGLSALARLQVLSHRLSDTAPGEVVEICPTATPIMAAIGARIAARGGAALIVDYGGWQSRGDTFQAIQDHCFVDPLARPGNADLTAHADFAALAAAARPAATAYATQGAVLNRLGIHQRAARLAENMAAPARASHLAATRRLTDDHEMGNLFKVLAVYPTNSPAPPGMMDA